VVPFQIILAKSVAHRAGTPEATDRYLLETVQVTPTPAALKENGELSEQPAAFAEEFSSPRPAETRSQAHRLPGGVPVSRSKLRMLRHGAHRGGSAVQYGPSLASNRPRPGRRPVSRSQVGRMLMPIQINDEGYAAADAPNTSGLFATRSRPIAMAKPEAGPPPVAGALGRPH
jgi:hypothetical protein